MDGRCSIMAAMRNEPAYRGGVPGPRYAAVSTIGLATLVAALHLALLAGRVTGRCPRGQEAAMLVWRQPESRENETQHDPDRAPSNPTRNYSAGRLALAAGMVIVALAHQVHLMRVGTKEQ